jgi:hypothetical protein
MNLADRHAGPVIDAGALEVRPAAVLALAREHDPRWFPIGAAAAADGRLQLTEKTP